jgi:hypothetical protein
LVAVAVLAEYAATDQRPHQPLEGVGVRADTVRQLIQGQGPFRQGVGDTEFGGHPNRLRHPRP